MKQQESTLFISFLVLISFCQGHAAIEVQQFWTEPIITWLVIVLPTGEHDFNTLKSQFSFAFKRSHLKAQFSFVFESIRTTLYARRSHSRMITHFHTLFHRSHLKAQCRSHLRAQFSPYISICSLARSLAFKIWVHTNCEAARQWQAREACDGYEEGCEACEAIRSRVMTGCIGLLT
jgi:hypothetical protein